MATKYHENKEARLICPHCGNENNRWHGGEDQPATTWCLECDKAFIATWMIMINDEWVNYAEWVASG